MGNGNLPHIQHCGDGGRGFSHLLIFLQHCKKRKKALGGMDCSGFRACLVLFRVLPLQSSSNVKQRQEAMLGTPPPALLWWASVGTSWSFLQTWRKKMIKPLFPVSYHLNDSSWVDKARALTCQMIRLDSLMWPQRTDCVNWPVSVTWKVLVCCPYLLEYAEHSYVPSCKLFSTLLTNKWILKPSLVTVKPPAARSSSSPFNVQDVFATGGLASISHCRSRSDSSSTVTSSDPLICGGSEGEHHRGHIKARGWYSLLFCPDSTFAGLAQWLEVVLARSTLMIEKTLARSTIVCQPSSQHS